MSCIAEHVQTPFNNSSCLETQLRHILRPNKVHCLIAFKLGNAQYIYPLEALMINFKGGLHSVFYDSGGEVYHPGDHQGSLGLGAWIFTERHLPVRRV